MDCIEHSGRIDTHGYGQVSLGSRRTKLVIKQAHRLAWERANGPIPLGICVLHRCDNRRCINVEHLFLGTKADNTRDMLAKGRGPVQTGSRNPRAKLNETDIPAIRALLRDGVTLARIAAIHHVSFQTISDIKRGRLWSHVKEVSHLHRC